MRKKPVRARVQCLSGYLIALLFLLPLHVSCSHTRSLNKEDLPVYSTDFQYEENQTLILLVDLLPDQVHLKRARIIEGNYRPVVEPLTQEEAVRIQYLDDSNQVLLEKVLDHPLIQYREYSDEKGQLQYVRLEAEKGALLLRSQYSKAFKSIRIDYGDQSIYRKISTLALIMED